MPDQNLTRQEIVQSGPQRRQVILRGVPDTSAVDQRVTMDQDLAEGYNLAKIRNLGRKRCVEPGELTKSLAENLKLALHRRAQDEIVVEISEAFAGRHVGDGSGRLARVRDRLLGHASKIGSRERSISL